MAKNGLRAAGVGAAEGPSFGPHLVQRFASSDTWIEGAFALEQGFIFTAMVLAAIVAHLIDRQFVRAGIWASVGALLSGAGLVHSFRYAQADTVLSLSPALSHALGYLCMALLFFAAPKLTRSSAAGARKPASDDDQD